MALDVSADVAGDKEDSHLKVLDWVRRRWFDVRQAYANYIGMVLGFVNFVLIISVKFPALGLIELMLTVGTGAVLAAMAVGYVHRVHQMKTDQDSAYEQSRLAARVSLVMFKMMNHTATKQDVDWVMDLLGGIAK